MILEICDINYMRRTIGIIVRTNSVARDFICGVNEVYLNGHKLDIPGCLFLPNGSKLTTIECSAYAVGSSNGRKVLMANQCG